MDTPQGLSESALSKITGIKTPPSEPQPETVDAEAVEAQDEIQSEAQEAVAETEELEFEDIKFALPKTHAQKVREALMRNADYTQKSKVTAERERAIEAREAAFRSESQFHQSALEDLATIKQIDKQLEQFKQVNWSQLGTEDLMRTKLYHDQIKEQRDAAIQALQQKQQQFKSSLSEQLKQLEKASYQEVTLKIPGFNESKKAEIKKYIIDKGYSEDAAARMFLNPVDVELIYKAQQYDALQASKPQINNRANGAPPVVKPGAVKNPMSDATKQRLAFIKEKDPAKKLAMGRESLLRKLGV